MKLPKTKKHLSKKWEITFAELDDAFGNLFKVIRRLPAFSVAETKMFRSKKEALVQFNEWLE